jgi:hypothetical protein
MLITAITAPYPELNESIPSHFVKIYVNIIHPTNSQYQFLKA